MSRRSLLLTLLVFFSFGVILAGGCSSNIDESGQKPKSPERIVPVANSDSSDRSESSDRSGEPNSDPTDAQADRSVRRIVSVVPGITEILFALDLGDRVVGVSRFCNYPPEVRKLPKIGGLLDLNFEAIVRLRPDLVILPEENQELKKRLNDFKINALLVNQSSWEGMLDSFEKIDFACRGNSERGRTLRSAILARLSKISRRSVEVRPTVMISLDRMRGARGISDVYIVGKNPFYQKIVELAGGKNAGSLLSAAVPIVSPEGIRQLNPDIIVDLTTDGTWNGLDPEEKKRRIDQCRTDWKTLGDSVKAVRNDRVYVNFSDYATIPGPRILLFIEDLARNISDDSPSGQ